MAGINVEQHLVFKVGTEFLKYENIKLISKKEHEISKLRKTISNNEKNSDLKDEVNKLKKELKEIKKKCYEEPWELKLDINKAFEEDKAVKLFDSQIFRLIKYIIMKRKSNGTLRNKDINVDNLPYHDYLMSLVIDHGDKNDFKHALDLGIKINDKLFKRFVGTTGGLKKNSVIFVNEEIIDELNEMTTSRTYYKDMVPAKFEAYKALTCSASQEIAEPNNILVVSDVITNYVDTIIELNDTDTEESDFKEPKQELKTVTLENNGSDGYNLCTIEFMERCGKKLGLDYIPKGLCLRNKWTKGMMYPFPIKEYVRKYGEVKIENGKEVCMVKDYWGNDINIMDVDLILTESSLKLASSYSSIDDYVENYRSSHYSFATTKIISPDIDDQRYLNYQYLQSFLFSDDDIKELCKPTLDFLKGSMGDSYENAISFLGIKEDLNDYTWQHALKTSPYMLNDPYVIESIHRLIKKKIDEAKMGKLICDGNFQTFCTDPVCLMEHILGLEVKGLLKENECYSSYWIKKEEIGLKIDEILAFRSPMTCHNNIRKLTIKKNEDVKEWYKYMDNIFIVNCFDSFMRSENGEDADGDSNFTTNNRVLLRCFRSLPAVSCIQKAAQKTEISEEILSTSNMLAFGNDVGTITNYVTSMLEVQARFEQDTTEYNELEYRIQCGQLYQQNCLDSIKGIVSKPMPKYWYKRNKCVKKNETGEELKDENGNVIYDDYLLSICAEKKPYFMIYRYPEVKKNYTSYQEKNNIKAIQLFGITLDELLSKENPTEEENTFIKWYYEKLPVGISDCAMNKICRYIEKEMKNCKSNLKKKNNFDYTRLKIKMNMTKKNKEAYTLFYPQLFDLCNIYVSKIAEFKNTSSKGINDKEDIINNRNSLKNWVREQAKAICPDDKLRLNIILDLCYGQKNNKQFCWDTVGKLIIDHLKEINLIE